MDKVSIIVPVFNVERYLRKCVDSLIGQTYPEIEILLVDDGSRDSSPEIMVEYANKDNRVKVLFQEKNKGVSAARNRALNEMTGDWVCFCDSDDWYEVDFIEKMMNCAQRENADYIICDYQIVADQRLPVTSGSINYLSTGCSNKLVIACGPTSSCTHMIRKELFKISGVVYPLTCKQYEELPVIPVLAKYAKKIGIVQAPLYNYYQRGNGTSASNISKDSEKNFLLAWNEMQERLGEGYEEELEYHAIYALLYGEIMNLCKKKEKSSVIRDRIKQYERKIPNYSKNKYINQMGISKKLFLGFVHYRMIFGIRCLSWVHSKIVN